MQRTCWGKSMNAMQHKILQISQISQKCNRVVTYGLNVITLLQMMNKLKHWKATRIFRKYGWRRFYASYVSPDTRVLIGDKLSWKRSCRLSYVRTIRTVCYDGTADEETQVIDMIRLYLPSLCLQRFKRKHKKWQVTWWCHKGAFDPFNNPNSLCLEFGAAAVLPEGFFSNGHNVVTQL